MSTNPSNPDAVHLHSEFAGSFASWYHEPTHGSCFRYSRMRLDEALAPYLPASGAGKRMLDLGCGPGHYMAQLRQRGFSVAGVDASDEMLELARRANPEAELRKADVAALPFPDASFDLVLSVELLRYLEEPERCVAEIARVLRPGGECLVTALPLLNANGFALVNRLAVALPISDLARLRQHFTTARGLERLFAAGGFRDIEVHGVYFGPMNWVERLVPSRLTSFLRLWEPVDRLVADRGPLKDLANMFLLHAVRGPR